MAEKRMFAKSIVLTDAFLDMPMSARCLYFTLGMLADDDGFVGSPKSIMRQCGASQDDLMVLLSKRFVLGFESGVIVIKHWRINNYLKNDRYHPTTYQEELAALMLDEKGSYTEIDKPCLTNVSRVDTVCIQDVSPDKNSIDKDSIDKSSVDKGRAKKFVPPSLQEVIAYRDERNSPVDPVKFFDYYEAGNWKDSKGDPVRNWKQKFLTWEKKDSQKKPKQFTTAESYKPPQPPKSVQDIWSLVDKI